MLPINRYYYSKYYTGRFMGSWDQTVKFLPFIFSCFSFCNTISLIPFDVVRCQLQPCLLLNSRNSLLLWFAALSLFLTVEIVFETAMKVWGKHLRPLTPTGTDTSQDMSFRKCYLTSTIFWMMYSSIYSWTGQYWSLLRLLLLLVSGSFVSWIRKVG